MLDEPNANLDADGDTALIKSIQEIKARGRTVVVMAHRPSAIAAVDKLLVLRDGTPQAFGPKDEVLAGLVRAAAPVAESLLAPETPAGPAVAAG